MVKKKKPRKKQTVMAPRGPRKRVLGPPAGPRKAGRIATVIDLKKVEMLSSFMITDEELAEHLNITPELLAYRKKNDNHFLSAMNKGKAKWKLSLRRAQYINAVRLNNAQMQIFLGKQYLGQRDSIDIVITPEMIHDEIKRIKAKLAAKGINQPGRDGSEPTVS